MDSGGDNSKVNMGYDGGHLGSIGPEQFCTSNYPKTPGSLGCSVPSLEPFLNSVEPPPTHESFGLLLDESDSFGNGTKTASTEVDIGQHSPFLRPNGPPSVSSTISNQGRSRSRSPTMAVLPMGSPGFPTRNSSPSLVRVIPLDISSSMQNGQKRQYLPSNSMPMSPLAPGICGYGSHPQGENHLNGSKLGPASFPVSRGLSSASQVTNSSFTPGGPNLISKSAQNGLAVVPVPRGRGRPRVTSTNPATTASTVGTPIPRGNYSNPITASTDSGFRFPPNFQWNSQNLCSTPKKPKLHELPGNDKRTKNAKSSKNTRERNKSEKIDLQNKVAERDEMIRVLIEARRRDEITIQNLQHDLSVTDTFVLAATQIGQNFSDEIKSLILQSPYSSNIRNVVFYPGLLQQLRTRNGTQSFVPDTTERYNLGTSMDFTTGTLCIDAAPAQLFPQPPFTQIQAHELLQPQIQSANHPPQ